MDKIATQNAQQVDLDREAREQVRRLVGLYALVPSVEEGALTDFNVKALEELASDLEAVIRGFDRLLANWEKN